MLLRDSAAPTEEWAKESAQIADGHAKCPAKGIDRQHLHWNEKKFREQPSPIAGIRSPR
jgi:hypothetical protein